MERAPARSVITESAERSWLRSRRAFAAAAAMRSRGARLMRRGQIMRAVLAGVAVLLFLGGASRTGAQVPAAADDSRDASFTAFLGEVEAAQVQLVNGRPDAFKALWSRGNDITLSGGLGGAIAKGWMQVSERLDWVATQY